MPLSTVSSNNQFAMTTEIDTIDARILTELARDGRISNAELANRVGLTASPCWTRVRRLEATGIIEGYAALINPAALGAPDTVFIEVTLNAHNDAALEAFGRALEAMPEVIEAHLVTGDYDYLVKVAVSGTKGYEWFLRERLYKAGGIRHTRSTFALRSLKQSRSISPVLTDAS